MPAEEAVVVNCDENLLDDVYYASCDSDFGREAKAWMATDEYVESDSDDSAFWDDEYWDED